MEYIKPLANESELTPEESESSFSEGYKKAYESLIQQGYPPRKAKRYLNSIAKRNVKNFMKKVKNNGMPREEYVQQDAIPDMEDWWTEITTKKCTTKSTNPS